MISEIYSGKTPLKSPAYQPGGEFVTRDGEQFYRIQHVDQMPPFFMSLVSGSDHWLFIGSNGGLTAGRTNAESALFPYETEDKLMAHADQVGSHTSLLVTRQGRRYLWEPHTRCGEGIYQSERHLYKNVYGSILIFEEINHDLNLTWRTTWRTGERFGFVKTSQLSNSGEVCEVEVLDGLLNILPYGATQSLQTNFSNLLNAYKRSELDLETGLATFSLSATLSDRAEPSESLKTTVAWQLGLEEPEILLSSSQLDSFRRGLEIKGEWDLRGMPGAYLVHTRLALPAGEQATWHIVADVNQDGADVVAIKRRLLQDSAQLEQELEADLAANSAALVRYVAEADGLQQSADRATAAHHFANVMFNVMRGGTFAAGYEIDKKDLIDFVRTRNRPLLQKHAVWFATLAQRLRIDELYAAAESNGSPALERLCAEYLPLTFSRRHGDPSRPWNRFSINLKHEDGSPRLDYQGNWRDIFQNWEPLLLAYPAYTPGVIAKFLNATTPDGYNPYRITREGIEWEVPEPDNPWANIGYWSDHQIIYLQKLLELQEQVEPGKLQALWQRPLFAYANVPYHIKSYPEMLADWSDTIEFDWEKENRIEAQVDQIGTDGRLVLGPDGKVVQATMLEKLLVLMLAKIVNLVPDGGIWMNTQRPEWNDANNALVGKGISVVTAAYLRRFVVFWRQLLTQESPSNFKINMNVATLMTEVEEVLTAHRNSLTFGFNAASRRGFMDGMGAAATRYREMLGQSSLQHAAMTITSGRLSRLLQIAQQYLEQTLQANQRPDGLYHAYNILVLGERSAQVEQLYLMLEGQVAILSAGLLTPEEVLSLLNQLRHSDLYRADQHSYMLYPNRELPGFFEKNRVPGGRVADSKLLAALQAQGDPRLMVGDAAGDFHFNGRFRNDRDLSAMLDELAQDPEYGELVAAERPFFLALFEETFNHQAFTGRSGTFFAYEGLGSIYWHMVSKLLLAVQENVWQALDGNASQAVVDGLIEAYYAVREGLGFNKSPEVYGAFPTDPYSHTPLGGGARQPGMTGQVKEEILTRWGELGLRLVDGRLSFTPHLLRSSEFRDSTTRFDFIDLTGQTRSVTLPPRSLAFTYCQTPIVYTLGGAAAIRLELVNGQTQEMSGDQLDRQQTQHLFARKGHIQTIWVTIPQSDLAPL